MIYRRTVSALFYISLGKSNSKRFKTFSEFNEMNLHELKNVQHVGILDLVHVHSKKSVRI